MLRRPHHATVISLVALFVALGGTSYAALTISGKNVKNGSLTGADVKNSSLTGKDVKNNSLTGSDIAESKLGKVKSAKTADTATSVGSATSADTATSAGTAGDAAKLGGQPASVYLNQQTEATPFASACDPQSATFVACGSKTVTLSRTSRLLLLGELPWNLQNNNNGFGTCRYRLDGGVLATSVQLGGVAGSVPGDPPFNASTEPLPAGDHTVELQCNETSGQIVFIRTRVTALAVSAK
jgi:hypothetical protein